MKSIGSTVVEFAVGLFAILSAEAAEVLPEHRFLAFSPEQAQIVRAKDESAAQKVGEWPLAIKSVKIPADWPAETNLVYLSDLYWNPYCDVRELDPKARFTVPATLCEDPSVPLSVWDRMPINSITVLCRSDDRASPPPKFFLDRGYRVRLDGKDVPVKTTPSLGAEIALELTPTPENPRNSEGDFVWLKDGTLLFAWSRFYQAGKHENGSWDNGGADIACRRSPDGGRTWSGKDEILVRNTAMNLMSVSFLRLADGRIALFYIEKESAAVYKAMMRTSADEAKSWSEVVEVTGVVPRGQYCLNNARVIQLKTGRILVPLAYHPPKPEGGNQSAAKLFCVRSDDGGRTWTAGEMSEVFNAAGERVVSQEPGVIELKDGRVMMWTRTDGGAQYAGYSSDGGVTWSAFKPTDLKGPLSPATIKRLKTGELIAVWNDHRGHPERGRIRAPLSIALSRDEGKTWSASVTLEENLTDFLCYTALVETGDDLLLAYCTKRERNLDTLRLTRLPRCQIRTDIEVDYGDKDEAVLFAVRELKRILRGVPGRIALREQADLPEQAWRFRSEPDGTVVIAGQDGMGLVYGVLTFLEKHAGVRWFAPDTEKVPDLTGWKLPIGLDETARPSFDYREMYVGYDFMDGLWRLRNKESIRATYAVGRNNGGPRDCHMFDYYAKALKATHPELFGPHRPDASGKECHTLCLTDGTTRQFVADEMCRLIEKDRADRQAKGMPSYTYPAYYDLGQSDGASGTECMCDGCRRAYEAAGRRYSGPMTAFAADVAARVYRRHPDVHITTYAYSYTLEPPTNDVRAAGNLQIRLCNSWLFNPLLADNANGRQLKEWAKHTDRFTIDAFWRTYRGMLYPFVKSRKDIAGELRFCRANGVMKYFVENEDPLSRSFAMQQHWLLLKMCEDVTQDVYALSAEFLRGYYGAAAEPIGRYLDYLESRQEESRQYLDREFFEKVNAWLDEAEALTKDDPLAARHVRWERVVVDRTTYDRLDALLKAGYRHDAGKVARRFAANVREQIETWPPFQDPRNRSVREKRLLQAENEGRLFAHYPVALPEQFRGRDVEVYEWNKAVPENARIVDDPDAAAGTAFCRAGRKYGFPEEIGFSQPLPAIKESASRWFYPTGPLKPPTDEKYHLYKLGSAIAQDPLFLYYDCTGQWRRYTQTIGIIPTRHEIWVSVKFQGPVYAPGSTKENLMLIDRVFFVKPEDAGK